MGIDGLGTGLPLLPVKPQTTSNPTPKPKKKEATPSDIFERSSDSTVSRKQGNAGNASNASSASDATNASFLRNTNSSNNTSTTSKKEYSADISRMREIWTEHDRQVVAFQRLVDSLLQRQASEAKKAGIEWDFDDPNALVDIDEETRANAQASIEEGGYFSVDATAARLLDFAVAISGGDPSRIEVLRDAVMRGYKAAEDQWGGDLPEISRKTLDAVMNGFDEWAKNGSASDITLLNSQSSQN